MKGLIKRLFTPSSEVLPPEYRQITNQQSRGGIGTWKDGRRLDGGTRIVGKQVAFVEEVNRLWDSLERLDQTKIRHARTRNKLNNLDEILQADNDELARHRQTQASLLADAQSHEKVRKSKRTLEEEKAEDELADYRAERRHTARLARQEELLARQEEIRARHQAFVKMRNEYIDECGGKDNMTEEQEADLKKGEKAHEEYLKESGLA